jgi:hypothetical protein
MIKKYFKDILNYSPCNKIVLLAFLSLLVFVSSCTINPETPEPPKSINKLKKGSKLVYISFEIDSNGNKIPTSLIDTSNYEVLNDSLYFKGKEKTTLLVSDKKDSIHQIVESNGSLSIYETFRDSLWTAFPILSIKKTSSSYRDVSFKGTRYLLKDTLSNNGETIINFNGTNYTCEKIRRNFTQTTYQDTVITQTSNIVSDFLYSYKIGAFIQQIDYITYKTNAAITKRSIITNLDSFILM